MRVRDLGMVAVESAGELRAPGGRRPGAILALLAMNVNRRVSVDALLDGVWDGTPTPGAASTLETHIWRLRQILEPDRKHRGAATVLVNDSGGYRLVLAPDALDSVRFQTLAAQARAAADASEPADVLTSVEAALGLWRGRPYEPFTDAEWAVAAAGRLIEVKAGLDELRIEALIELGQAGVALAELEQHLAQNPYRERLWAHRMLALSRLGRSEEALRTYQQARKVLLDEVGISPGAELQELQQQILQQGPTRGGPAGSVLPLSPVPARPAVEVHLPVRLNPLLGREHDCTQLSRLLAEHPLVTITGTAGCGKTRLAIDVAREAARYCSDGVWFVDLSTIDAPAAVAEAIVSAIGFEATPGQAADDALGDYVTGKRLLLLLDNCEHVVDGVGAVVERCLGRAAQVDGELRVLATSREPLAIGGEIIWTLGPLAVPTPSDTAFGPAVQLFIERVTAADPQLVLDEHNRRRAAEICIALDGLPLALELSAARVRTYSLDEIAEQTRTDPNRLSAVGVRGRRASLLDAIEWSHRLLGPYEQLLHRRLAVLPGPFVRSAAAALAGSDLSQDREPAEVLDLLVHRSMISAVRLPQGGETTFRQLIPVRAHAARELLRAGEEAAALSARAEWVMQLAERRPSLGHSGDAAWYDEVGDSYAVVRAVLQAAFEQPDSGFAVRLTARLAPFWFQRGRLIEAVGWLQRAVDGPAPDGDDIDLDLCRTSWCAALSLQGGGVVVSPLLQRAMDRLDTVDPSAMTDIGLQLGTIARSVWIRGDIEFVTALAVLIARYNVVRADDDLGVVRSALICARDALGPASEALARSTRAVYEQALDLDNLLAAYFAAAACSRIATNQQHWVEARAWVDRTLDVRRRLGDVNSTLYLETRASLTARAGDPELAVKIYAAAERESIRFGMRWPLRPITTQLLTDLRRTLNPASYERAWAAGAALTEAEVAAQP